MPKHRKIPADKIATSIDYIIILLLLNTNANNLRLSWNALCF